MKKKYLLITFFTFLLFIFVIILFNSDLTSNGKVIQDSLSKYSLCLSELKKEEYSIVNDYNSVTGEKYNNDHATLLILENIVIPNYTAYLEKVKQTETYCDEINEIHDIYVTYSEKTLQSFICFKEGLRKNDSSKIKEGKSKLDSAKNNLESFNKKLSKLSSK